MQGDVNPAYCSVSLSNRVWTFCHKKKTVKMFSHIRLGSVILTYHRLYTKNEVPKVAEGALIQV
jgi:hypothetical protein